MKQLKDKATVDDKLKLHTTTLRRLSDAMTDDQLKQVGGGLMANTRSTSGGCP